MDSLSQIRYKLAKCIQVSTAKNDLQPLIFQILKKSSSLCERYYSLEPDKLLRENVNGHNAIPGISALINALKILEKYGVNLLRVDKPPQWRVVRWSNPVFHQQVDNIKGARDILKLLGYTETVYDGVSFPNSMDHPNKEIVSFATSDIILLKYELVLYQKEQHPNPHSVKQYFHFSKWHKRLLTPTNSVELISKEPNSINSLVKDNSLSNSLMEDMCAVCGLKLAEFFCPLCKMKQCAACDQKWHLNRSRAKHQRERICSVSECDLHNQNGSLCSSKTNLFKTVIPSYVSPELLSMNKDNSFSLDNMGLKEFSSAKPVIRKPHQSSETSINWDEKFQEIESELASLTDVNQQHKLLDNFSKEVDRQVQIYNDQAKGAFELPNVQQHFFERSDSLSKQKKKLVEKFSQKLSDKTDNFVPHQDLPIFSQGDMSNISSPAVTYLFPTNKNSVIQRQQPSFPQLTKLQNMKDSSNFQARPLSLGFRDIKQPLSEKIDDNTDIAFHTKSSEIVIPTVTSSISSFHPLEAEHTNLNKPVSSETEMLNKIQLTAFKITPLNGKNDISGKNPVYSTHAVISKCKSDVGSNFYTKNFSPAISNESISDRINKENLRILSLKTINKIRNANMENMASEEIQIAVNETSTLSSASSTAQYSNPWKNMICELIKEFPTVSYLEACKLYLFFEKDIELTKNSIRSQHLCRIKSLSQPHLYSDQILEDSLRKHHGNFSKALVDLQKPHIENFKQNFQKSSPISVNRLTVKNLLEINDRSHLKNIVIAIFSIKDILVADMMCSILFQDFELSDKTFELRQVIKDYNVQDVFEAAKSFPDDVELAVKYLSNKCNLCLEMFSQNRIECMTACGDNGCSYCQECLAKYLDITINEGHIRDLVCPVCKLPDIDSDEEAAVNHFSYLDAIIKKHLTEQAHAVYQKKLTDKTLMKMPNFRWCSHCENGFVYEQAANNLKMLCPACKKATCYNCKKTWEPQHEGITCQEFLEWKQLNDEDFQAAGLAAHLKENGINCPSCNFRYALAKGGCMHFKCIMCSFQFCSGCKNPFKQGQVCNILSDCSKRGLHAHHPRDCLFYMRDLEIERLQQILSNAQVPYGTESNNQQHFCQVIEQKETSDGLVDAECGREVLENNADLCVLHYKEYLVNLINDHHLDPADVFTIAELEICLKRSQLNFESRIPSQSDDEYKKFLLNIVKKMPLIHQKNLSIVVESNLEILSFQGPAANNER